MMEEQEQQPEIRPEEFVAFVTQAENLAEELSEGELNRIAHKACEEYELDKESMKDWREKMKRGVELAELVKEDKDYPFKGAANIKYPLITSAALQFNARAYPAIVPADNVVKAKTHGADPQGAKAARGERVSGYMSWQLTCEIEEWEEETDKLLVQLPIVGTMVRKVWFDPVKGRACCRVVDAGRFIVNDKVQALNDAPRCTEELPLYPDEIRTRINSGQFIEFDWDEDNADSQAPQDFIEQHRRIDLDEDGYGEPYIVTVHKQTKTVVRIVADFEPEDVKFEQQQIMQPVQDPMAGVVMMQPQAINGRILEITRGHYFIPYHFVPSMSGGFWSTGLGLLLGDINSGINSIINMLLDAGHYASLGGGFIGKELRLKGGSQRMKPGEWKMVGTSGQDIRQAVVPMTFPGPDATLFSLLGMLIEAGREVASVKDVMTGDSSSVGANASPTTTIALIEQGMMVFTAAYKRIFRSLKQEYKLLSKINAETVDPQKYNAFHDEADQQGQPVMHDPRKDFAAMDMDIQPVADPRSVTKMQEAAKAQLLQQLAAQGMVDPGAASARILDAMEIGNTDELVPQPDPMAQMMGQIQMRGAQADLTQKMADIQLTLAKVETEKASVMEKIATAQTDAAKLQLEDRRLRLDGLMKLLEDERARLETAIQSGLGAVAGTPGNDGAQGSAGGNQQGPQGSDIAGLLGG